MDMGDLIIDIGDKVREIGKLRLDTAIAETELEELLYLLKEEHEFRPSLLTESAIELLEELGVWH